MNKKALLKAILAVMGLVAYMTLSIFAFKTHHPVLIGLMVGPLILGGLLATGIAVYIYFDEDDPENIITLDMTRYINKHIDSPEEEEDEK